MLCESVKTLGTRMKEGFETEGALRKEDYKSLEEKMSARMEEGFKNEQHAGQQIQSEIVHGFKKEENARKMVQNELAVMKDELKSLKMGSGSTVCTEASTGVGLGSGTFAEHPPTSRWNEIFVPRRMEFKGWSLITLRLVLKGSQTMKLRHL